MESSGTVVSTAAAATPPAAPLPHAPATATVVAAVAAAVAVVLRLTTPTTARSRQRKAVARAKDTKLARGTNGHRCQIDEGHPPLREAAAAAAAAAAAVIVVLPLIAVFATAPVAPVATAMPALGPAAVVLRAVRIAEFVCTARANTALARRHRISMIVLADLCVQCAATMQRCHASEVRAQEGRLLCCSPCCDCTG